MFKTVHFGKFLSGHIKAEYSFIETTQIDMVAHTRETNEEIAVLYLFRHPVNLRLHRPDIYSTQPVGGRKPIYILILTNNRRDMIAR